MRVIKLILVAATVAATAVPAQANNIRADGANMDRRALLSRHGQQGPATLVEGTAEARQLGIGKWFKKAGKDIKKTVIDPIVEYYSWGSKDSKSNLQEASTMLDISDQIYYDSPRDVGSYTYLWSKSNSGARVGLWRDSSNNCVVVFRGMKSASSAWNALTGIDTTSTTVNGYKVIKNFKTYYDYVSSNIEDKLESTTCSSITCTGHSLGGASAAIGHAAGLCSRSITFGAPRTFKGGCNSSFRNNARRYFTSGRANWDTTGSIPNAAYDPIPSVPAGATHCAGTNVHLASWSDLVFKMHYRSEKVPEITPTTGANFVIHGTASFEEWFDNGV
mmetsp:Transcript_3827/g.9505  ORF Transcript_3827/g.9505 Transcript_3827/m.9505 type:complete len:333 (+) Transcript_3827:178-1176(+)